MKEAGNGLEMRRDGAENAENSEKKVYSGMGTGLFKGLFENCVLIN